MYIKRRSKATTSCSMTKEFFFYFHDKLIWIILYALLIPISTFGFLHEMFFHARYIDVSVCLADCFIQIIDGYLSYISFIILSCLVFSSFIKRDFTINFLIRHTDLKSVWIKQSYFACLIAIISSIYRFITIFVFSSFYNTVPINFDQKRSFFAFANNGITTASLSTASVLVVSFLYLVLTTFFMLVAYNLIVWIFNRQLISFLVVLIMLVIDRFAGIGLSSFTGVYYTYWLPYRPMGLIVMVVLIAILFGVGLQYTKCKEFLYAK